MNLKVSVEKEQHKNERQIENWGWVIFVTCKKSS